MNREPDYQRGGISLYRGDCLDVLPTLEAGSVDAVVTDPPYGILNRFAHQDTPQGKRTLQFDWDRPGVTDDVLAALRMAFDRCSTKAGCVVFCGDDQFGSLLLLARQFGFTAKKAGWFKTCPPPALPGNWWPSAFELAVYGYRTGAYFGDTDPKRSNVFVSDSMRYGQPGKNGHPTQKPIGLMRRIVSAVVPPDGLCLDCYAGSGTTLEACALENRQAIGIELDPHWFDVACKRVDAVLDQGVLF